MPRFPLLFTLCALIFGLAACSAKQPQLAVDRESAIPGTTVSKQGNTITLLGTGIELGQQIPSTDLVDASTMQTVDLQAYRGKVLLLSIVPSIDTKVCETQTHLLGEEGDMLPSTIQRITISRDTPFAQKRFADEAKLTDIQYLSDYKEGAFGRSTGLLLDGPRLLARSVILVDKEGIVRYIQVVPDITHLPDMDKAFAKAIELNKMQ
ncbi:thiol peroxidase [Desulfopila aestuarii]|uniref:Thiol peroxidase, atypical 2-Cys peroxiredoxin n=1 Tax=Desulfopila aestuarii DSM 18488 TaxID=1121416 RepID=A0A1M7YI38_9BACT|nr:thiol peroxidase [Desulfopila aestuarii]SHO52266.1 thiol peroxidase, atypical 2-Cys peroxiredoxin [Desulfopila aestuarii DSM 18488]